MRWQQPALPPHSEHTQGAAAAREFARQRCRSETAGGVHPCCLRRRSATPLAAPL